MMPITAKCDDGRITLSLPTPNNNTWYMTVSEAETLARELIKAIYAKTGRVLNLSDLGKLNRPKRTPK